MNAASIRQNDPDSCSSQPAHTSSINTRREMIDVPDLFDIVWTDRGGLEKMNTYIEQGGNPNLVESTGQKRSLLDMFSFIGDDTFVSRLLTGGASVDYVDTNGHNALYHASVAGNVAVLTRLITHIKMTDGEQSLRDLLNTADTRGVTSLHIASVKGYDAITETLLRNRADVDKADHQGRTALHFACYMGHEGVVRHLLGHNARVTQTTREGLTPIDFFKLGELKEDVRRSNVIETLIAETERRLGIQHVENKAGQRVKMRQNDALRTFMETFQRKCGSVFLAYRALESEAIQHTTDTFTISNMLNILGSVASLPGSGLVFSAAGYVASSLEDKLETAKKETLTHLFKTVHDMESAVEQAAYDVTRRYEDKIVHVTVDGARTLALCGVGRFVESMRADAQLSTHMNFSERVLASIQRVKPNTVISLLPWMNTRIETKDQTINWTERSIFEEVNSSTSFTTHDTIITQDRADERAATILQADRCVSNVATDSGSQSTNGMKGAGCCTLS